MTSRFSNWVRWLPGLIAAGLVLLLWGGAARALMQRAPGLERDNGSKLIQESTGSRRALVPAREPGRVFDRLADRVDEAVPFCLEQLAVRTDPEQALSELEALLESEELASVEEWLLTYPAEAANWIEALPEGAVRNVIVDRVLASAAKHDPQGALKVAEAMEEPEARGSALSSVLRQWAADAPEDALREIVQRTEFRETPLLGQAFVAAAVEHPFDIAALLNLCPEEQLDKSFVTRAAEALLSRAPAALSAWTEKIQDEELRSAVAETIVFHCARNNPEIAFQWATQLTDADRRERALRSVFAARPCMIPAGHPLCSIHAGSQPRNGCYYRGHSERCEGFIATKTVARDGERVQLRYVIPMFACYWVRFSSPSLRPSRTSRELYRLAQSVPTVQRAVEIAFESIGEPVEKHRCDDLG